MGRVLALAYALVCYAIFFATFLYAVGFIGGFVVPKGMDDGRPESLVTALVVDALLLGVFAVQHSVMARQGFKRWWTRFVPTAIERSTYVLLASSVLLFLFWQWRPIPAPIWTVHGPIAAALLEAIFWFGWAMLVVSTFLISHFELFGLSQVFARLLGRESPAPRFHTPLLYRRVRHPIYLSFLLVFWATPVMTVGHLLFSLATTGYILIAIQLEERDLVRQFGDQYRRYRGQVAMLIPLPGGKRADRAGGRRAPGSIYPL